MKVLSSWSGGKDSCFALMQVIKNGHKLGAVLNMMNEDGKRSRSHGLSPAILKQQAEALQVPFYGVPASWADYEKHYIAQLQKIKSEQNVAGVVFGDIDLQAHRDWEEKVCAAGELEAILPLWQQDRKQLVYSMIEAGIEAVIVSCNLTLGESFLGKRISKELVDELESLGVDACGENGEYHTAVVNCPLYSQKIELPASHKTTHNEYCFLVWD